VLGALTLNYFGPRFTLPQAAATGIIGRAGPTAIALIRVAPDIRATAVAAYSYMAALVPLIQRQMKLLTTEKERKIRTLVMAIRSANGRKSSSGDAVAAGGAAATGCTLLGMFCLAT
jgi:Na+-transporting methylmalonyl-CoA/oxaloacetate decarboxylase beta subunit